MRGDQVKKFLVLIIFVFSWVQVSIANDILSKKEFSERYREAVSKMHPDARFEMIGDLELKIILPEGKEQTSFLNNAYADYSNNPSEIDSVLHTYAESLSLSKKLEEETFSNEQIFPVIKDFRYIEQVNYMFEKSGSKGLVYEKLNDVLYILYAFDTPKSIRFMAENDLVSTDLNKSELLEVSKNNLQKNIPNLRLEGDPSSLSMLVADGTYESSFLLFDNLWTKEQFPVKGNIVVYVPSRDLVLITGSEDKENLLRDPHEFDHSISSFPF